MSSLQHQQPPSCWTCRVRRKKCDRTKPRCNACAVLEITCHYSEARPEWMDGGDRQNEMAKRIKAEVRQGAEARRERQYIQVLTLHEDRMRLDEPEERPAPQPRPSLVSLGQSTTSAHYSDHDDNRSDDILDDAGAGGPSLFDVHAPNHTNNTFTPGTSPPSSSGRSPPVCPDCVADGYAGMPLPSAHEFTVWNLLGIDNDRDRAIAVDVETDFTITFLDYVFPFIFPFYQPSVLEGGRSWLLALLRSNTAFFHSGMSLSAYFFTLILKGGERHQVCSQQIWNKLIAHVDTAVRAMQQDMEDLKRGQDGRTTIFQKGKTMESILQLLVLEHSMARTSDWNVHLSAAMAIFQEIFDEYGVGPDGKPDMVTVVCALGKPSWQKGDPERVVWHSGQGAFRFYAAFLIFTDIIASTSLESPPRLRKYHGIVVTQQEDDILPPLPSASSAASSPPPLSSSSSPSSTNGATQPPPPPPEMIRMENFFGCQGWVLLTVADVAVLDAWKKEGKARGQFCYNELMEHGSRLHQRLQAGLARLERESFRKRPFDVTSVLRSYYRPDAAHQVRADEQVAATRIWALAATAYLGIVVTGWAAATRTTASSIAVAMQLLYGISSPAVLRSLAWPFYVLGCLATKEQEKLFTHMAGSMGPLLEFGTVGEALRIMRRVWELRDAGALDVDTWDLAACSRVLGTQVLMT